MTDLERAAEYHRGYEDGLRARDASLWRVEHERREVADRLLFLDFPADGSHANLSRIFAAIMGRPFPWNAGAGRQVVAKLIWLLTGEEV